MMGSQNKVMGVAGSGLPGCGFIDHDEYNHDARHRHTSRRRATERSRLKKCCRPPGPGTQGNAAENESSGNREIRAAARHALVYPAVSRINPENRDRPQIKDL